MKRSLLFFVQSSLPLILPILPVLVGSTYAQSVESFGSGNNQFSMAFSMVGNPGNSPSAVGVPVSAGSVPYDYRIGKFEVSREQVEKANSEGGLGLTMDSMDFVDGSLGSGPRPEMPATGLTWNEAARFVNWLNVSQGYQAAYRFSTQPGQATYNPNSNIQLWTVQDSFVDGRGVNRYRHKNCRYFLPSVDEWFKAAHYDPTTSSYVLYPTGDTPPESVTAGAAPDTAIFDLSTEQGPANINAVGGPSAYGVMGLGGNVWEFEESAFDLLGSYNTLVNAYRGGRGGAWNGGVTSLSFLSRLNSAPNMKSYRVGLRIASVAGDLNPPAQVVGSFVYYANSFFATLGIDAALDSQKSLAKEGQQSQPLTYQNLINTGQGINGIVFDIRELASPSTLSATDFDFQVSPIGGFEQGATPPYNWLPAPSPASIEVVGGATSRVVIRWPENAIENRWLRITLRATSATGLAESETYYLGHLLGETTGLEDTNSFRVQFADIFAVRDQIGQVVGVSNPNDIDKNGTVQFSDLMSVRQNSSATLLNISVP